MGLRGAALSIKENYAQAMAVTAPLGSVVSTTTAAIAYSGGNIVFASILAFLASALWIYSLSLYSSRFASAGGYYTFVYAAYRSKFLAFSEAVVEFFSFVFLNAVNVLAIYLMFRELLAFYGLKMEWWFSVAILALSLLYPTIASYAVDVKRLLGTVVIFVATLEVLALLGLFALSLEKGFKPEIVVPSSEVSL
ncbi:MAG: amino acid permease, partial [Acidilobaceae archaeon]